MIFKKLMLIALLIFSLVLPANAAEIFDGGLVLGAQQVASSSGTTVLTINDAQTIEVIGTQTHTIQLIDAFDAKKGWITYVSNHSNSVAGVRITDDAGALLAVLNENDVGEFILLDDGTSKGRWSVAVESLAAGGTAANIFLSNLGPTAINQNLLPNVDYGWSLGSSSLHWQDLYVRNVINSGSIVCGQVDDATAGNLDALSVFERCQIRLTGAVTSLRGIAGGIAGQEIIVINASGADIPIPNDDGNPSATDRILTGNGLAANLTDTSVARFVYDGTTQRWRLGAISSASDHGALTGLLDDDHPQYALLAGRSLGQSLFGSSLAGGSLVLGGTSDISLGDIFLYGQLHADSVIYPQGIMQVGVGGSLFSTSSIGSGSVSYLPAAISNWLSDPTTVQQGLDNLAAAKISGLWYVSKTSGVDSTTCGMQLNPCNTISQALTNMGAAANAADVKRPQTVFIEGGAYDESITIPDGRLVNLIGLGTVVLGDGAGANWASTTPRNIVFSPTNAGVFGSDIKPSLTIGTINPSEATSTFVAEANGFYISGSVQLNGTGISHNVYLHAVKLFGNITKTSLGLTNLFINNSYIIGTINISSGQGILERVYNSEFDGLITVTEFNHIQNSEMDGGMTVTGIGNFMPPSGMFHTDFAGTFTGPANSARFDLATDYFFRFNGATLAGGATKVILSPYASTTVDGIISAADYTTFLAGSSLSSGSLAGKSLASGSILVGDLSGFAQERAAHGDFTIDYLGAGTIVPNAVTNSKLAQMGASTFKGNSTGGAADPQDLTATQATALLNVFIGDSGAGGVKGLVPAPASGDAAALKFLKADGTWAVTPSGGGSTGAVIVIDTYAADQTLSDANDVVLCNPPDGTVITITLHSAAAASIKEYSIKNISIGGLCVVVPDAGDDIEGDLELILNPGGRPQSGNILIPNGGTSWSVW